MNALEYSLRALTPIVTGDAVHRNDKLLGTGLRGSLRYQYWLIKAMEQWAVDPQAALRLAYNKELNPLTEKRDLSSHEKIRVALEQVGPVVQLFGTTGWRAVFDLRIDTESADNGKTGVALDGSARSGNKAAYRWQAVLRFVRNRETPLLQMPKNDQPAIMSPEEEIQKLMAFVHHHGWLGAAPQNGHGWVRIDPQPGNAVPIAENPFFAARELLLTRSVMHALEVKLNHYFSGKLNAARYDQVKKERYAKSLRYIAGEQAENMRAGNTAVKPIGYEIRRYLKSLCPQNNPFGHGGFASHVHVTHPVEMGGQWAVRLRYCTREGIAATDRHTPGKWLDWCTRVLMHGEIAKTP